MGSSPEGEKLQSDSGVFLDSHSLQDNQPSKGEIGGGVILGEINRVNRDEMLYFFFFIKSHFMQIFMQQMPLYAHLN